MPKVDGIIKIQISNLFRDGKSFLQISVYDNGPGISPDDKIKLFKPFSKLAAHSHLNPNGNGLGLSICKLICRSLGGDIVVHSDDKKWTKFTFWIQVTEVQDCDADPLPSGRRDVIVIEPLQVQTKSKLTMQGFLQSPEAFGALAGNKKLSIIVADDIYYNLEALRLIF